jgi:hypothetical protein
MTSRLFLAHTRFVLVAFSALLACLISNLAAPLHAVDPCDVTDLNPHPCGNCGSTPYESKCWFSWARGIAGVPMTGFPLNVSLWQAVGPCDYPPISNNQLLSTSPLISSETSSFVGQSPFRERAVHNGLIDMVTGLPLIREVDFELPFGGAVFRHVRTYSEVPMPAMPPKHMFDYSVQSSDGAMWDWNGMNWMMSENPLFLIDCSMRGIVEGNDPLRCYFIPDAHHAIPFIKSASTADPHRYVAPPWFDAVLKASEASDLEGRPTHFNLWLHGGAIQYTIEAHYEDMWLAESGVSAHLPPNWGTNGEGHPTNFGGYGIPHYGLVKKIEDRYGNWVEIVHCEQSQADCINDGLTGDECCQNLYCP